MLNMLYLTSYYWYCLFFFFFLEIIAKPLSEKANQIQFFNQLEDGKNQKED